MRRFLVKTPIGSIVFKDVVPCPWKNELVRINKAEFKTIKSGEYYYCNISKTIKLFSDPFNTFAPHKSIVVTWNYADDGISEYDIDGQEKDWEKSKKKHNDYLQDLIKEGKALKIIREKEREELLEKNRILESNSVRLTDMFKTIEHPNGDIKKYMNEHNIEVYTVLVKKKVARVWTKMISIDDYNAIDDGMIDFAVCGRCGSHFTRHTGSIKFCSKSCKMKKKAEPVKEIRFNEKKRETDAELAKCSTECLLELYGDIE